MGGVGGNLAELISEWGRWLENEETSRGASKDRYCPLTCRDGEMHLPSRVGPQVDQ
jgi:hypothetical protein